MKENAVPNHVAIIMDGNRRWAKERGKNPSLGHLEGSKTLEKTGMHIFKTGVKVLSVFAFSTENFKRSEEEVTYLMDLLIKSYQEVVIIFDKTSFKQLMTLKKRRKMVKMVF